MKPLFRRITTGVDPVGKSYAADDVRIEAPTPWDAVELWRDKRLSLGVTDGANAPHRFYPLPGETLFRIVQLPPATQPQELVDHARLSDEFFRAHGIPECRVDTTRHPFMHQTPTIDYAMLLSGQVSLLLDVGEPVVLQCMDTVVQRATNHMWVNTGNEAAFVLVVMIGASGG